MAKVNLTLKDRAGGRVSFRLTSHPEPASNMPEDMTPAQKMGLALVSALQRQMPLKAVPEPESPVPVPQVDYIPGPYPEEGPEKALDLREGSGY